MNTPHFSHGRVTMLTLLFGLVLGSWNAWALPKLDSVVPARDAVNVPVNTTIVFTFSEAMDTDPGSTFAMVLDNGMPVTSTSAWSGGNKILTCTPAAPLGASHTIVWFVFGTAEAGGDVDETGQFTTGSGASGVGCDPAVPWLSFTVSKGVMYEQTSASPPSLYAGSPYCFLGCITLPCPREATNVTFQAPGQSAANMSSSGIPGHLRYLDCGYATSSALDAAYHQPGTYTFVIQAAASNQTVTVDFPSTLTQPPAPHVSNYAAAQAINPAQPFTLSWDPLTDGTAADCIYVEIYGGSFHTPNVGEPGALTGTATSAVIPAGTLQPNQSYSGCVTFYHYLLTTNGTSHGSLAYRGSTTEFNLNTVGASTPLVLTNLGWAGSAFTFEVICTNGQSLIAKSRTNLTLGDWQTVSNTTSTSERVRITDPAAATNRTMFYRVWGQ